MKKNFWLYVLKLESGKYYVGITTKTPEKRFKQHVMGTYGAAWTRKYKPLRIFDSRHLGYKTENEAKTYEDKVVREYIKKYGIDNVRGGDISLTDDLVVRYGRWWKEDDWDTLTTVTLLSLVLLMMTLLYYTK